MAKTIVATANATKTKQGHKSRPASPKRGNSRRKAREPEMTDEEMMEIADFGPAIDEKQMQKLEQIAQEVGVIRRLTLLACARSADALSKISLESPAVYGELRDSVDAFKKHAAGLLDLAESASFRMAIADCRAQGVEA
ncbi:MAG: hypothetical protein ABIR10_16965 [Dokdonella sp.]